MFRVSKQTGYVAKIPNFVPPFSLLSFFRAYQKTGRLNHINFILSFFPYHYSGLPKTSRWTSKLILSFLSYRFSGIHFKTRSREKKQTSPNSHCNICLSISCTFLQHHISESTISIHWLRAGSYKFRQFLPQLACIDLFGFGGRPTCKRIIFQEAKELSGGPMGQKNY